MSPLREGVASALERGRPEQAWDLAATAWSEGGPQQRHEARRLLASLVGRLHPAAWTSARKRVLGPLQLTLPPGVDPVGVVAFPAVGPGGSRFLRVEVRERSGDQAEDTLPEGLDPETRVAMRSALEAARRLLDSRRAFAVHVPEAPSWGGPSCGLATGLAAVSAARALALPVTLSASGELRPDGTVDPVGGIAEKLVLRFEARPRGRLLVSAREAVSAHPAVVRVSDLAGALEQAGLHTELDPYEVVDRVRKLDRQAQSVEAAQLAATAWEHPDLDEEDRVFLLAVLLGAANHAADAEEFARWRERADAVLAVSPATVELARCLGSQVVRRVDDLDLPGAREALQAATAFDWSRAAAPHIRGPRALVATLAGEHDLATSLRRENLRRCPSVERARCSTDLADALVREGRPEEALEVAEEGRAAAQSPSLRGYQQTTLRYLELQRARALRDLGRVEEARAALDEVEGSGRFDLDLRAILLGAELDGTLEAVQAVVSGVPEVVQGAPLVRAILDRSLARLGDAAAAERLLALPVFTGLELDEASRRLPY